MSREVCVQTLMSVLCGTDCPNNGTEKVTATQLTVITVIHSTILRYTIIWYGVAQCSTQVCQPDLGIKAPPS